MFCTVTADGRRLSSLYGIYFEEHQYKKNNNKNNLFTITIIIVPSTTVDQSTPGSVPNSRPITTGTVGGSVPNSRPTTTSTVDVVIGRSSTNTDSSLVGGIVAAIIVLAIIALVAVVIIALVVKRRRGKGKRFLQQDVDQVADGLINIMYQSAPISSKGIVSIHYFLF